MKTRIGMACALGLLPFTAAALEGQLSQAAWQKNNDSGVFGLVLGGVTAKDVAKNINDLKCLQIELDDKLSNTRIKEFKMDSQTSLDGAEILAKLLQAKVYAVNDKLVISKTRPANMPPPGVKPPNPPTPPPPAANGGGAQQPNPPPTPPAPPTPPVNPPPAVDPTVQETIDAAVEELGANDSLARQMAIGKVLKIGAPAKAAVEVAVSSENPVQAAAAARAWVELENKAKNNADFAAAHKKLLGRPVDLIYTDTWVGTVVSKLNETAKASGYQVILSSALDKNKKVTVRLTKADLGSAIGWVAHLAGAKVRVFADTINIEKE